MNATTMIFGVFGTYLALGVIALLILDILTSRVRHRFKGASTEVQAMTGENRLVAVVVTAVALLIFWPLTIYAAIRG